MERPAKVARQSGAGTPQHPAAVGLSGVGPLDPEPRFPSGDIQAHDTSADEHNSTADGELFSNDAAADGVYDELSTHGSDLEPSLEDWWTAFDRATAPLSQARKRSRSLHPSPRPSDHVLSRANTSQLTSDACWLLRPSGVSRPRCSRRRCAFHAAALPRFSPKDSLAQASWSGRTGGGEPLRLQG